MTKSSNNNHRFSAHMDSNNLPLKDSLRRAAKKIAPVWPLENFVAVNPFLGLADQSFDSVAQELATAGGIQMTLPTSFYLQKMDEGELSIEHIATALKRKKKDIQPEEFLRSLIHNVGSDADLSRVLLVTDVATKVTGNDWSRFVTARVTDWAASYFDRGQAQWATADQEKGLFESWRELASIDLTPEVNGFRGFRRYVKSLPANAIEAADWALKRLHIPSDGLDIYLHSLLLRTGGWSAYAARIDWDKELYGGEDGNLIEFLAVLLCWEASYLECLNYPRIEFNWKAAAKELVIFQNSNQNNKRISQNLILQEAFDIAVQDNI